MTEDSEVPEGDICLRQANVSDEEFLFEVYASTREDELAVFDWSSEQKQVFFAPAVFGAGAVVQSAVPERRLADRFEGQQPNRSAVR